MEQPRRRLSAVWFADIVGYTELSNRDEPAALQLVRTLQTVAGVCVEEQEGRVVKYIGDAVLAEFGSTESAVRAAVALQERYVSEAKAQGTDSLLRIGVHLGEVTATSDGDLYGDGINTAARLQHQADPGQIIISEDVWRQLRQRPEFRFSPLGNVELRGISTSVNVYDVLFGARAALAGTPGDTPAAPARAQVAPAPAGRPARAARTGSRSALVAGVALLAVAGVGGAVAWNRGLLGGAEPADAAASEALPAPVDSSVAAPVNAPAAEAPAEPPPAPSAPSGSSAQPPAVAAGAAAQPAAERADSAAARAGSPAASTPAESPANARAGTPLGPRDVMRIRTQLARLVGDMNPGPGRLVDAHRVFPTLPPPLVQSFQVLRQKIGAGAQFSIGVIEPTSVQPNVAVVHFPVVVIGSSGQTATFPFEARLTRQGNDWIVTNMRRIEGPGTR